MKSMKNSGNSKGTGMGYELDMSLGKTQSWMWRLAFNYLKDAYT